MQRSVMWKFSITAFNTMSTDQIHTFVAQGSPSAIEQCLLEYQNGAIGLHKICLVMAKFMMLLSFLGMILVIAVICCDKGEK